MRLDFHPEALREMTEAAEFYAEREHGLGIRFLDAVEIAIAQILDDPSCWRLFGGNARRCLLRVFPYAIIYAFRDEVVVILAVMHCGRMPGYWIRRMGEGESFK